VSVAARNFIDGAFTSGSGNRSFENFTPVDCTSLGLVPEGGEAEVAAARAALTARGAPWP